MGTVNIIGTGGIIEGNLQTNNVNVNLDSSLSFDGVDDKIDVGDVTVLDGDGSITVAAWVNFDSDSSDDQRFVWKTDAFGLGYFSGQLRGYIYYSGGDSNAQASHTVKGEGWKHVAMTYDGTTLRLYINGTEAATTSISSKTISNTSNNLRLGGTGTSAEHLKGKLADVRLYSSTLTASEIQILASKILSDTSLGAGSSTLVGWWKLNNNSITDSSTNSNNGTATGTTQIYDAYSVDVYDNNTTTDGTFTVTQGKVEGKALTKLDFSGDTQLVSCTSNTFYNSKTAFSVSAWIKPDAVNISFQTVVNARDGGNDGMALSVLNQTVRLRIGDGSSDDLVTGNVITSADRWYHLVATRDASNNTAIYVDGVLSTTGSSSKTISVSSGNFGIGGRPSATSADEYNGEIRDVGCWSYDLSAEQAASLYSGTYPQTPNHEYKLDEGSGTTVNDTGTETAANGTITGATYTNGTLDLDGTTSDQLRISANGTLSAPRGNLAIGGAIGATVNSFENYGTFIHNNGTVTFDATADYGQRIQETATAATAFYNLTHNRSASSYHLYIKGDITVENTLLNTTGFVNLYGPNTLTMGTASSAGAITMSSSGLRFYDNDASNYAKIYGASSIYPFVYTGNEPDIDTYSSNASHVAFKNGDIQVNMTSDYQGGIVRLDGDMEFDAVTINANDDFDINGQRAHFGGVLTINSGGDLRTTDGGLIIADANLLANGSIEDYDNADVNMIVNGGTGHDWRNGQSGGGGHWCENVLTNGTVTHGGDQIGPSSGSSAHNVKNIIVGSGTFAGDAGMNPWFLQDLSIATGGTVTAGSRTIDLYGDFTTSGGLIGKSAGEFVTDDGATNGNYIIAGSSANSDGWTNQSVECWIKLDHLGRQGSESTFFSRGGNQLPKFGLYSGKLRVYAGSASKAFGGTGTNGDVANQQTLVTGKWYHVAMTYNNTTGAGKLYVDGKLDLEATIDTGIMTSDVGESIIGAQSAGNRHMDGVMGKISIWNHELTQNEIRKLMFMTGAEMQADNTNFPDATANDCKFFYNFDEGTGATIADSGPGGNNGTWAHNNSGTAAVWAGSGTFAHTVSMADASSTSTNYNASTKLIMRGAGTSLNYISGEILPHLNISNTSGTITANAISGTNNLTIASLTTEGGSSEFTAPAGTLTITSENSDGMAFELGAYNSADPSTYKHSNGTVTINNHSAPAIHAVLVSGQSTATDGLYNVIIDGANTKASTYSGTNATYIYNNFTVTNGNFKANGASNTFTVLGDVLLSAGNMFNSGSAPTGAHTYRSLEIANGATYKATSGITTLVGQPSGDYILRNHDGGTFTHGGGTVTFSRSSASGTKYAKFGEDVYDNVIIDETNTSGTSVVAIVGVMNLAGDLTVTDGELRSYGGTGTIDVGGHVSIASGGKFSTATTQLAAGGVDATMKSLSIASGGEYDATPLTTTIDGEGDGTAGSSNGVNLSNSGTFTHNQGTIKVTCATQTTLVGFSGTNAFYNYTYAGTGSGEDQVLGGNTDFFGHVIVDSANSELQSQGHTFNYYGGITIKQGGWDIGSSDESGTVNVYGGVRNVGGSIVA